MNIQTICYVAGKSGGHIIPCLTLADNSQIHGKKKNILFFSSNMPLDKTILSHNQHIKWHVTLPLSTRAGSYIKTFFNAFCSFLKSFFYLCKHRPAEIITTGGIVAIPPCIAGFILRIPIILYSLDAVPGQAIQFLTPLATSIITPFVSSKKYFPARKCSVAEYPIKYMTMIEQQKALEELGLDVGKKTIAIFGGSQGSLFLNECIKKWIQDPSFPSDKIQIIHQTGSLDSTDWNQLYADAQINAYAFSYHPNLTLMYAAADIIICRAGAGTLFEVKFFNKPGIIIPLKTDTTTHQIDNARAMVCEYPTLFHMLEQNDVEENPALLYELVLRLLKKNNANF